MLSSASSFFLILSALLATTTASTATTTTTTTTTTSTSTTTTTPTLNLGALHAHAKAHRTSLATVLTPRQLHVLSHVSDQSSLRHGYSDHEDPADILSSQHPTLLPNKSEARRVLQYLFDASPLVIHLHIHRALPYLLNESHYRNFFETNMSNAITAHTYRFEWEKNLFDGMYDESEPYERVKYGLLDVGFTANPHIARFYGWSKLLLKSEVRWRCTYTFGDSTENSKRLQNLTVLETLVSEQMTTYWRPQEMRPLVLAAAAVAGEEGEAEIKERIERDEKEHRQRKLGEAGAAGGTGSNWRWEKKQKPVDYIEAQIHGPIDLSRDVEALIVDKYFQTNETLIEYLEAFTERFGVPYRWTDKEIGRPRMPNRRNLDQQMEL